MDQESFGYGRPVWSLQFFLREIAYHNSKVPMVVPDGIYGGQTKFSVENFQALYGLPATGEVDQTTWDTIQFVYTSVLTPEPTRIALMPLIPSSIPPGAQSEHLFAIQGVMMPLTRRFSNLGNLAVTGVHDQKSVDVVKKLQAAAGFEPNGVIDQQLWEHIAQMYETFVSRDRISPVP